MIYPKLFSQSRMLVLLRTAKISTILGKIFFSCLDMMWYCDIVVRSLSPIFIWARNQEDCICIERCFSLTSLLSFNKQSLQVRDRGVRDSISQLYLGLFLLTQKPQINVWYYTTLLLYDGWLKRQVDGPVCGSHWTSLINIWIWTRTKNICFLITMMMMLQYLLR